MTTPRDFVKHDPVSAALQQRCESFLDTLAAKGATDSLFLFEELLEAFPVGRYAAILILGNWLEKRASPSGEGNTGRVDQPVRPQCADAKG